MPTPIIMPKFGQATEESTIISWRKTEGDKITIGDILFEAETDKAVMEVESFAVGTLLKIVVPAGVSVPVQSTVGFIGQPGDAVPEVSASTPDPSEQAECGSQSSTGDLRAPSQREPVASRRLAPILLISPRAGKFAKEYGIDPTHIRGTGPDGRIIEKDVKAYLDAKQAVAEKPLSKMRQVIAQRLTQSAATAPHFFVTVSVDVSELMQLRSQLKEQGASYTVTDFISEAVVRALKEFPDVNSATDGKIVRTHSHVHLGVAVSLDQGLVVPVVRNAEELTLCERSQRSKELVEKARTGKLTADEMAGSTFTISNMGMLDVENFTAIINPGESAILAVSSVIKRPVVRDDQIVVCSMMKMTLSSDHRLIDGAMAARFANAVRAKLEDAEFWNCATRIPIVTNHAS